DVPLFSELKREERNVKDTRRSGSRFTPHVSRLQHHLQREPLLFQREIDAGAEAGGFVDPHQDLEAAEGTVAGEGMIAAFADVPRQEVVIAADDVVRAALGEIDRLPALGAGGLDAELGRLPVAGTPEAALAAKGFVVLVAAAGEAELAGEDLR